MSSKMEVIVPEHPADNSAGDLRGILFVPVSHGRHAGMAERTVTNQGKYRPPGSYCILL